MLQPDELLEVKPTPQPPAASFEPAPAPVQQPDHDLQDLSQNISAEFRSMRGTTPAEDIATAPIETPEATPVNQAVKDILRSEAEFSSSRIAEPTSEPVDTTPVVEEPEPEIVAPSIGATTSRLADILASEAKEAAPLADTSTVSPLRRIQDAVKNSERDETPSELPENVSPLRRIPSDPPEAETPSFTPVEPEPKVEESQTGAELRLLRQRIFDLEKTADEPATTIQEPETFVEPVSDEPKPIVEPEPILEDEIEAPEISFEDVIQSTAEDIKDEPVLEDATTAVLSDEEIEDTVSTATDIDAEGPLASFADAIEIEQEQDIPATDAPQDDGILEAGEGLLSVAALRAEREARAQKAQFQNKSKPEPIVEVADEAPVEEPAPKAAIIQSEPKEDDIVPLRAALDKDVKQDEPSTVRVRKFGEEPPMSSESSESEQLPDVDELNTSLRMDDSNPLHDIDISEDAPKKRGFYMRGILTAILIFLLFALLFLLAKPLAQMFPFLAPFLEIFSGSVGQGLDVAANTAEKNSGVFGWVSNQWEGMVSWLESF